MKSRFGASVLSNCRRWMKQKLGIQVTILVLSFFVGIFGATAAIIVKNLMHLTVSLLNDTFPNAQVNYFYLAFPIVGIVLTVIYTRRVIKDHLGHGVSIVLKSIFKSEGKLRRQNM